MKDISGAIKFKNYIVDSIKFQNNPEFNKKEVQVQFEPSVDFNITDNNMLVYLKLDVFKDAYSNNYPFELSVKVVGLFEMTSQECLEKYKANAVAILFPYVRSIISTCTSSANIPALILPTVNINKMLDNE